MSLSAVRCPRYMTERITFFTGTSLHVIILSGNKGVQYGKESLRDKIWSQIIEECAYPKVMIDIFYVNKGIQHGREYLRNGVVSNDKGVCSHQSTVKNFYSRLSNTHRSQKLTSKIFQHYRQQEDHKRMIQPLFH